MISFISHREALEDKLVYLLKYQIVFEPLFSHK